ncbi:hypothetical protein BDN70DRAFT_929869 [Pholiota conissans]|uniref:Uncharacterized protein n=1 Tax=Pholiota conissans TaxID=109636 RepID=A0A9P5Z6P0_9AGAR|nr:hypothetical protein BDN70DRAFT_929869 [Pholiota conissans]
MPKAKPSPKSFPKNRAKAPAKPRKVKMREVQDRATWRSSWISPTATISKTNAMRDYRLTKDEMEKLTHVTDETVKKIKHVDQLMPMYLYNEVEVELLAWKKRGGPEMFEKFLQDQMTKFYTKNGTSSAKEFHKPSSYHLPNDPALLPRITRLLPPPDTDPSPETSTPKLLKIKAKMEAKNQKWLWDAMNEHIARNQARDMSDDCIHHEILSKGERDELMTYALNHLRYPPRPTSSPPSGSASFGALVDLLDKAASTEGRSLYETYEDIDVDEDPIEGFPSFSWKYSYMIDVYDHLDAVKNEYGQNGWERARWLVYDKYVECGLGGLWYEKQREDGRLVWNDSAEFWLSRERLRHLRE